MHIAAASTDRMTAIGLHSAWNGICVGWVRGFIDGAGWKNCCSLIAPVVAGRPDRFTSARTSILRRFNMNAHNNNQLPISKPIKRELKRDVKREIKRELKHEEKAQRQRPTRRGPARTAQSSQRRSRAITRVVGTGVEAPKWAGRVPHRRLSDDGRSCDYSSVDYVGTVSIASTAQVGDVLFSLVLSPLVVPSTRLQKEAGQWERYAPREWEFLLSSMHGTTFDGQVIAFVDPDPIDAWTNTPLNLNKAAAQFDAQPDNVWKNFETSLPIVSGVPAFYTNPLSSSDARFTQAGVLRVVYTGGCVFPQGVTSHNLFNVYQRVNLRFSQPELDITQAAAPQVGQAKTTTPTRANLLNGATVSSAIPVTITPTGADIDTGNLGGNNLVVELIAAAENLSDVASSFGIDLGVSGALDSIQQTVRLGEKLTPAGIGEAASQYLFSGAQSWSITPSAYGLPNVQIPNAVMNLFPVPATVVTLADAQKLTRQRRLVAADPPLGATSSSGRIMVNNAVQGDLCFKKLVEGPGGRTVPLGFNPSMVATTVTINSTNYPVIQLKWIPAGPNEQIEVVQMVSYGESNASTGFNHDDVIDTLPSQGLTYQGVVSIYPTGGGSARGQVRTTRYATTGTGECTLNLLDITCTPASGQGFALWGVHLHINVYPDGGFDMPSFRAACDDDDDEFCEVQPTRKATVVARRQVH